MLKRLLSYPSVQSGLCVAAYAWAGDRFGARGLVIAAPLLAAAIVRPLMNLLANFRYNVRAQVLLPLHGKHYAFKGITIHVLEDVDRCRWIPLADVRKVAGMTASDSALEITYPERFMRMGKGAQPHLRDDALVEHLGKENNPVALRFRTWVEREVSFSSRRIRKRLGIHPEPGYKE